MTPRGSAVLSCHWAMVETDLEPIGNTGVAYIASISSGHVVCAFTCCNDVVVTVCTQFTGLIMGKRLDKIIPARAGGVAQLASIGGIGVRSGFVAGIGAGMTCHTGIGSLIMGKRCN